MSERNPWLGEKKHSSFLDGSSSGWPDWDTNDSSKCRDRSRWSSWEIYQGNKDIHKDDAVGKGAPTALDSWSDKKRIEQCNSEISERNPWLRTENHSSSLDNSSRGWSDWDTGDSPKCNKHSGWPSWESLQGNKDLHKDDAIGKGALTISDSCSGEQRGRGRVRKRSTERGRRRTPKRDKSSWETKRSRSRERDYGKSRNGSPFSGLTQASCVSTETGSDFGMTSRRCRDFAAGKCVRGSRCRFVHHGYLEKRERNHLENQVAERSRVTADHGGSLQHGDYKRSADSLRDISNGRGKYYEDDEGRKNTICCKQFLRGKCYRGTSCRYSHHKAAGEDYHKGNEGAVCVQNVKSLAKLGGRSDDDKWEQNFDVTKSWNGPRWDNNGGSLDTGKNRACLEDEKKSWNGPKWGDEASFPDAPKATGWGDSSARTTNSRDPATAEYRTDESKVKGCPEWSEKLSDKSKKNGLKWDNGGGSVVTGKNRVCSEDEKNPWNGPTWGDEACFPDEPKAIGWGKSSARTTNSHDPVIANYRTEESKVKRCREWSEILSDRSKKNGPEWDNNAISLDTRKNRACLEDEKKSWNGPKWGDEASFPDEPKATGWGDSSARTTNSHDPATADYRTDESKVKGCPEWSEKLSDRSKKNGLKWDNGGGSVVTGKNRVCSEDEKNPWNGPTWGDEACFPDEPKAIGWGKSSARTTNSHDPVIADYRTEESKVKRCREWSEILSDRSKKNGPEWDNNALSLDTRKNRACLEDEKKSWNGPKWGDEASFPDEPKATGWGDSSARTTNSHDPATADYRTDESKVKGCPEWSEKLSDRSKKNGLKWDNGGGSVVTGKNRVCSEDEKNPWNGPTWGDEACFPDEPKAIGWGNSSARTTNSHDPVIAVYRTDESKVKRCREWSEIFSDRSKKNGPKWDNNASRLNTRKNRACTEDEKKPWNGPSWGDEASFPDDPKATGWGESSARTNNSHDPATADYRTDESKVKGCPEWSEKVSDRTKKESPLLDTAKAMEVWEDRNDPKIVADRPPSSGRGNSSFRNKISHVPVAANELNRGNHSNDPTCSDVAPSLDGLQGTVWDGRSRGNMYSQDRSVVKKQIDNNLVCSSVKKSSQRADPGWSEKFPERDEWCSGGNGADNHHTKLTDLKMLVNRKKPVDQWEDKATLWSGPTWDDKDCSSDRPEATGWGGRSRGNTDTHVSADTEKENVCEVVNSLAQKSNGSVASRWNEKVTERDEYMLSHWQNNYNGRVTRTSKPTDSIRLMDGEEATNEWEDGRKCLDKGTSKLVDSEKLYEVGDLGFPPSSSRSGTNESCHAPSRNHFNGLNNFLDRSVQHKVSVRNQMRIQLDKAVKIPENGERELINLESSPTPVTENGQQNPLDTTGEQCKQDHRSTHSASFEAQCNAGESNSNQDTVMTWSFKIALVELVKEILKPTWKKGKMSKEVHIAIVKKAVDKVISAETERDNIPKTQEHIDYYLSVSKPCITNFVKEYIVHYGIQDDLGR